MEFYYEMALNLCILIPAIIGLVRFTKISKGYYPFVYCIWIGLVNEIVSCSLALNGHYNIVNGNIYMLLESLLLLWQFKNWGLFKSRPVLIPMMTATLIIGWVLETLIFFKITAHYSSNFQIGYSFLISLMSISILNKLIVTERKNLLKNATFILCIAFVMYYTFSVLSESFWIYGIGENPDIALKMQTISTVTNFISILLYSVAILWMPSKQKFILPSS